MGSDSDRSPSPTREEKERARRRRRRLRERERERREEDTKTAGEDNKSFIWGQDSKRFSTWMLATSTEVSERTTVTGVPHVEGTVLAQALVECHMPPNWELAANVHSHDDREKMINFEVVCTRKACTGRAGPNPTRLPVLRFFSIRYMRLEDHSEIRVRRVGPFEGYEPRCRCRYMERQTFPDVLPTSGRRRSSSWTSEPFLSRSSTGVVPLHDERTPAVVSKLLPEERIGWQRSIDDLHSEKAQIRAERRKLEADMRELEFRRSSFLEEQSHEKEQLERKLEAERKELEALRTKFLEEQARVKEATAVAVASAKDSSPLTGKESNPLNTSNLQRTNSKASELLEKESVSLSDPNTSVSSGNSIPTTPHPSEERMQIPWSELEVDTTLNGQLGSGGWGKVQRGWWLGTPVAVKLVDIVKLKSGTLLDSKFKREMQSLDRARHPNVIALMGWASRESEAQMALVTEVCKESLQNALDDMRCGSPTMVLKMLWDVARALTFLHHIGIGHRDMKPGNVLLTEKLSNRSTLTGDARDLQPLAKVCDFGMAKVLGTTSMHPNRFVVEDKHSVGGTEIYHAPELARAKGLGQAPQTIFVDQWAFAICALEALENNEGVHNRGMALVLLQKVERIVRVALGSVLSDTLIDDISNILVSCGSDQARRRPKFAEVSSVMYRALAAAMKFEAQQDGDNDNASRALRES